MKILFDHQIFSSQVHGGVSKYFAEIIHQMPVDYYKVSAWLSNNEYAYNYKLFDGIRFFPNQDFRGKGRIMSELGKVYSLMQIINGDFDVFHQTNFDTYCIKALNNKPMVTTYHDVNFLTSMNYNKRMHKLQIESLERADKIIAISHNTKKDMLNYFNIDESKINVIHHGIEKLMIPLNMSSRIIESPYILYVGLRHAFKNFENFIKAFALLSPKYPEVKVVCTRQAFSEKEAALFEKLKITNKMEYVVADETTLSCLYRDALFFCFPSKYEGFGMPILEAMINNCPVALSNASCFPEIAGDSAIYFEPDDIDSIKDILEKMLVDENLRNYYRTLGSEHVKQFSWKKCAEQHINVYKSLL